jgi:hypothetical protein
MVRSSLVDEFGIFGIPAVLVLTRIFSMTCKCLKLKVAINFAGKDVQ